jgi:hypothetical protein
MAWILCRITSKSHPGIPQKGPEGAKGNVSLYLTPPHTQQRWGGVEGQRWFQLASELPGKASWRKC